jgi:hypothetical protein
MSEPVEFRCWECNQLIGMVINGRLYIAGVRAYRLHGEHRCGAQVHWDAGEVVERRRIKRRGRTVRIEVM